MPQFNNEEASVLSTITSSAALIQRLVESGVSVDEFAEKIAAVMDPDLLPALQTLGKILRTVEGIVGKVAGE